MVEEASREEMWLLVGLVLLLLAMRAAVTPSY